MGVRVRVATERTVRDVEQAVEYRAAHSGWQEASADERVGTN
eukprot:COSAG06_NODE_57179_length_281_cov_0.857143_1_plen_41_part_10